MNIRKGLFAGALTLGLAVVAPFGLRANAASGICWQAWSNCSGGS